jgi:hypothetical protein
VCVWHVQELGDSGHLVHSGILSAANWLADRLACIALVPLFSCSFQLGTPLLLHLRLLEGHILLCCHRVCRRRASP